MTDANETQDADCVPAGTIEGRIVYLSEGRSVWVGRHETGTVIRLVSRRGEETKFAISHEARAALLRLLLEDECA